MKYEWGECDSLGVMKLSSSSSSLLSCLDSGSHRTRSLGKVYLLGIIFLVGLSLTSIRYATSSQEWGAVTPANPRVPNDDLKENLSYSALDVEVFNEPACFKSVTYLASIRKAELVEGSPLLTNSEKSLPKVCQHVRVYHFLPASERLISIHHSKVYFLKTI